MNTYVITASLPLAGSAEDFSYRMEASPDPSGSGYALWLVVDHVGGSFRTAIVRANTATELDRLIWTVGFSAAGEAQIALEDLSRRELTQRR